MNFTFVPPEWSWNSNIYEVNLRQYTQEGTFEAFSKELPRLRSMGVETLWFMPVTPIGAEKRMGTLGSYYACSSYTSTNPEFGSVSDFKMLVGKCHELGCKVIIDWVANHTAWDHEWTRSNPEFYKRDTKGSFYDNNGWVDVIDLNYYDHSMRRKMIAAMEFWVKECDIDGFRCDMAHLIPLDFWRDARQQLGTIKNLFWLAETEDYNYQYVFDCSYAWSWMLRSEKMMKNEASVDELRLLLLDYQKKTLPSTTHAFFTSNHDENSWNGTEYEKYGPAALCMAVIACTWNGMTLLYSGQEMPNHKRLKFFEKDTIEWTGEYHLHQFYKTLLQLRASFGASPAKVVMLEPGNNRNILGFIKISENKQVLVLLNFSGDRAEAEVSNDLISGTYTNVFDGSEKEAPSLSGITMEPWSYLVFEKQ